MTETKAEGSSEPRKESIIAHIKNSVFFEKRIDQLILRDQNNLDLVRLILAAMVIYGHAFSVTPHPDMGQDLVHKFTNLYAASIAIKGFFMISGLLVTYSLLRGGSIAKYAVSRFFRIWPALIGVTLLMALVIGPFLTKLPPSEYFSSAGLFTYIEKTIALNNWGGQALGHYDLPGVFENNAFAKNVNAPLWSIAAEVFCYIILALVFATGGLNRWVATAMFVLIIVDGLVPQKIIFFWLPQSSTDFSLLPFCFALGALFAIWRDKFVVGFWQTFGLVGLAFYFQNAVFGDMLSHAAVFACILYVAGLPWVLKLTVPVDISYGVYLYGWPVQQVYNQFFPNSPHIIAVPTCMLGAALLGAMSAYLIERPAMKVGRSVSKSIK